MHKTALLSAIVLPLTFTLPAMAAGCRLSTTACSVITGEMAKEAALEIQDKLHLARGMAAYQRSRALIARRYQRMTERMKVLPKSIADEFARIMYCNAQEHAIEVGMDVALSPVCK